MDKLQFLVLIVCKSRCGQAILLVSGKLQVIHALAVVHVGVVYRCEKCIKREAASEHKNLSINRQRRHLTVASGLTRTCSTGRVSMATLPGCGNNVHG